MKYLAGYPPALLAQVQQQMQTASGLAGMLRKRYPSAHEIRTDRALYDYVAGLKADYLRNAAPLAKVAYDNKLHAWGL